MKKASSSFVLFVGATLIWMMGSQCAAQSGAVFNGCCQQVSPTAHIAPTHIPTTGYYQPGSLVAPVATPQPLQAALATTKNGLPVNTGTVVTAVTESATLAGTVSSSPSAQWLGLNTDQGLVFVPVSSVTQIWPEHDDEPFAGIQPAAGMESGFKIGSGSLTKQAAFKEASGNIYERLWQLDQQHNGLTVSVRNSGGEWVNPDADIKLDEQNRQQHPQDKAPAPLFANVDETKLDTPIFNTAKALFDNYVAEDGKAEDALGANATEDAEIEAFLNAILDTEVMKLCREDIENRILGRTVDDPEFKSRLRHQWFGLYDNFYRRNCDENNVPSPKKFSNGFEHVFIGDYSGNDGIGGHHSWFKFYLDEQAGNAGTLGFNYPVNSGGETFPWVSTFAMNWTIDGSERTSAKKGFLVGNSPELLIAWGTTAQYETEAEMRSGDTIPIEIDGAKIDLVVYLETLPNCEDGDQIKSQFPRFVSLGSGSGGGGGSGGGTVVQTGPIKISRAMINPDGDESGREWVDILHAGDETDGAVLLDGWKLCDKHARCQEITGSLEPGETIRVVCTRETNQHPQLSNSNGTITVRNGGGEVVARVTYQSSANGVINIFHDEE